MNKIERYSLHAGLKIAEPFVNDCFFPIVHDKYVTFHAEDKLDGRKYDYLQEVIDLILPALKDKGIKIIQLGTSRSQQFDKVYSIRGLASFNQESYAIKNSLLHFGSDGHQVQLAGHHGTPFVSLYSIDNSSSAKPEWGEEKDRILIDSPKGGKEPTHMIQENPKTINGISPFEVAGGILNLLKIKTKLLNNEVLNIGENYHIQTVEVVPDFISEANFLSNSVLNVRLDLHHNEDNLFYWSKNRKLGIITKSPIEPNVLAGIRPSILRVSAEIDDDFDEEFLKNLKKYMIPYELFTRDKDSLRKYRLKYIDEEIKLYDSFNKKKLDKIKKICNTTLFKSSKIILSNGKKYQSEAHWVTDNQYKGDPQTIIDTKDFWSDAEHYLIYNEVKQNGKTKGKQKQNQQ